MKSAVIVIDVQRVLFEPKPQPYDCIAVLSNINAVTHWARKMQYPVVFFSMKVSIRQSNLVAMVGNYTLI